jgi:1-acyl-sn-glycerol-3-phosphate acyltransferase
MMFPEGTQGNRDYMLPFKRGAFEALKAVHPLVLSYTCWPGNFKNTWECLGFIE